MTATFLVWLQPEQEISTLADFQSEYMYRAGLANDGIESNIGQWNKFTRELLPSYIYPGCNSPPRCKDEYPKQSGWSVYMAIEHTSLWIMAVAMLLFPCVSRCNDTGPKFRKYLFVEASQMGGIFFKGLIWTWNVSLLYTDGVTLLLQTRPQNST